jgi:hypothetical protein
VLLGWLVLLEVNSSVAKAVGRVGALENASLGGQRRDRSAYKGCGEEYALRKVPAGILLRLG